MHQVVGRVRQPRPLAREVRGVDEEGPAGTRCVTCREGVDPGLLASEWPWLPYAADDLVHDCASDGTTVVTRVSVLRTDPWTARFGSPVAGEQTSHDPTEGHQP